MGLPLCSRRAFELVTWSVTLLIERRVWYSVLAIAIVERLNIRDILSEDNMRVEIIIPESLLGFLIYFYSRGDIFDEVYKIIGKRTRDETKFEIDIWRQHLYWLYIRKESQIFFIFFITYILSLFLKFKLWIRCHF